MVLAYCVPPKSRSLQAPMPPTSITVRPAFLKGMVTGAAVLSVPTIPITGVG